MPGGVGFQRSRALWENCRRYDPPVNVDGDVKSITTTVTTFVVSYLHLNILSRYGRAILYELQPIRYSVGVTMVQASVRVGIRYGIHLWCAGRTASTTLIRRILPMVCQRCYTTIRSMTYTQWKWTILIALYYMFVRWMHETIEAGPVVIIVTALAVICTVGLSDHSTRDGLSAYSVFNQGFQKIMGSIDADELLQQHVGGGGAGGAGNIMNMMMMMQPRQRGGQGRPIHHHHDDMDADHHENDDEDGALPPPRPRGRHRHPVNEEGPVVIAAPDHPNPNRARRTGKKARRMNHRTTTIEQRREIQAQRDAALAMGWGHIPEEEEDDDAAVVQPPEGIE